MTGNGHNPTRATAITYGGELPLLPAGNLASILLRAADKDTGGIVLVRDGQDEERLRYSELLADAAAVLGALRARGAHRGDRVVAHVRDERDLLAVFWACVLGGMVALPLGVGGGSRSPGDLDALWHRSDRVWLVADGPDASGSSRTRFIGTPAELRAGDPADAYTPGGWDDLAVLLLTSGSTGVPKAVMLSHGNILSRTAATIHVNGLTAHQRSFNWMPLDHVGGLVMFHVRDVALGCSQAHARIGWVLDDPLRWIDQMHRHRSTATWAPNFAFGLVNDNAARMAGHEWDLSNLHYIMNGGEAVKPAVLGRFLRLLMPFGLPADAVCPGWGMSETSSGVVDCRYRPGDEAGGRFITVGVPHPGVALRVVNQFDEVLPEGEPGLLQVSGEPVTVGYYNNAEHNRRTFTADRWFRTGDLAYIDGGRLTVTGRDGDTLVVGGTALHGHEIESTAEEIGGVEPSFTVACAVADGEGGTALAVFYHPRSGVDPVVTAEEIGAAVRRAHGVDVAHVVPLARDDVPKTGIGKLRRALLAQRFEAGEFAPLPETAREGGRR